MKPTTITAEELDQRFDNDEDVLEYFDLENIQQPNLQLNPISIDFPQWMIIALDQEARRLGVSREAIIKFWIADRLEHKY